MGALDYKRMHAYCDKSILPDHGIYPHFFPEKTDIYKS
jgi:hypothetical protein